jgi:hypothetical protein
MDVRSGSIDTGNGQCQQPVIVTPEQNLLECRRVRLVGTCMPLRLSPGYVLIVYSSLN